jgi:hypothetical protein
MQASSLALALATGAFVAMLIWRVRPSFGSTRGGGRAALRDAQARIESAADEPSRARALCDAGDLMAARVAGSAGAQGLYMRAMRADPASTEVVARAVAGLAKRPRVLESVLWRHLSAGPWTAASRGAMTASLDALRALYEGPRRNAVRARALANVRDALGASSPPGGAGGGRGPHPGGQKTEGSA